MKKTLEHNGLSITVSSLTNVIGFASGYMSSLDSIRSFGVFAAIGIMMVFFNCLTCFGGLLSYDAHRQKSGCSDCFGACCCLGRKEEKTDRLPPIFTAIFDYVVSTKVSNIVALLLLICFVAFGVIGAVNTEV